MTKILKGISIGVMIGSGYCNKILHEILLRQQTSTITINFLWKFFTKTCDRWLATIVLVFTNILKSMVMKQNFNVIDLAPSETTMTFIDVIRTKHS